MLKKQDQVTGLGRPLMPNRPLKANNLPETSCEEQGSEMVYQINSAAQALSNIN